MGSDLARLGRSALLHDRLPPFRNVSPGPPPDSLPSLAQLGCTVAPAAAAAAAATATAPPSTWTAVNHPPQREGSSARRDVDSSSPSPIPDRAPDVVERTAARTADYQEHHQAHHAQHHDIHSHHTHTHTHSHSHSHRHPPLHPPPSSLSRHPRLAPKRPIGSPRQDSAASESPSPTVAARRSPDAPEPSHGGAFASSPTVDSLVPSPVLAPSLGPSSHARAAIHPLTHPHAPLDPPQYSQCPPPRPKQSNHHPPSTYPPALANGHPARSPARSPSRARRPKPLSLPPSLPPSLPLSLPLPLPPSPHDHHNHNHHNHPPSASTASPPPRPLARPRRRTRGERPVHGRALPGETPPVAAETMAQMAPPLLPPRDSPFPVSPASTAFRSPASPPMAFARPSSYPGAAVSAVNGVPRPESGAVRAHRSPARQADHASPAPSSTADDPPRCHVCNQVYQPSPSMDPQTFRDTLTGIRVSGTQSLADYNQTMESLVDIIRCHYRHPDPDSDLSQWWEQHQHDSAASPASLAHPLEPEALNEPVPSNKRRRLSDGGSREERERYYAFHPTSGDTVFVTRPIAAIFPGDVPRQPYVPPPENNQNMWYIPSETPRKPKRKSRHRTGPNATRSESDARGDAARPDDREGPRRRSSGAAPLDRILHS